MKQLTIFNAGGTVERNGVLVPVKEEIPPFAVIVLGEPDKQSAGFNRDGVHVWRAYKPGANASLYRPEIVAINGPGRIPYGGYGEATQAWPAPAAVDLSETADSERPGDMLKTHATLGPRNDSWCLHPGGGLFTQMGLHAPKAVSLGSTVDRTGERWENVTTPTVCWVSPRTVEVAWMTGWRAQQTFAAVSGGLEVDPRRSVVYRLQRPAGEVSEGGRLFEPIADNINHDPTAAEQRYGIAQVSRQVRWVKVRDAGTYRVSLSFSAVDNMGPTGTRDIQEIGCFAAWPDVRGDRYKCIPYPAVVARRDPMNFIINGEDQYGNDVTISGEFGGAENVAAVGIMELDAGWAFGFVPIYSIYTGDDWAIENFQCTVERIGPPSDVSRFWEAIAAKVTYSAGGGGFTDPPDSDDAIAEYPVDEPESLIGEYGEEFLQPD